MKATRKEDTMRDYARWYWPIHHQRVADYDSHELERKIIQFLGQEELPTPSYREWIQDIKSVILRARSHPTNLAKIRGSPHKTHHRENLFFAISVPETHLTAVCAYGYSKYLKDHAVFPMDWNRDQVRPHSAYSKSNDSFLAIAAQEGHTEVVEILLDRGANILSQDHPYQYDALLAASRNGNLEVVKLLLDRGGDIHEREYSPWQHQNVLQAAIRSTEVRLVELLLDRGADKYRGIIESKALSWALGISQQQCENSTNLMKLLLDRSPVLHDVDSRRQHRKYQSMLLAVISSGKEELVGHVLDRGYEYDRHGGTLQAMLSRLWSRYYLPTYVPEVRVIKMLLERGADIHAKGGKYGNSLQATILGRGNSFIVYLLDQGIDMNLQGGKYGSPLHAAVSIRMPSYITKLLLHRGAESNAPANYKYGNPCSVLKVALGRVDTPNVQLLLDRGAVLLADQEEWFEKYQQYLANEDQEKQEQEEEEDYDDLGRWKRPYTTLEHRQKSAYLKSVQKILDKRKCLDAVLKSRQTLASRKSDANAVSNGLVV